MSFEPVNSPFYAQHAALPLGATPVYQQPTQPNYNPFNGQPMANNMRPVNNGMQQPVQQQRMVDPRQFETPQITTGSGIKFNIKDETHRDITVPIEFDVPIEEKKKRGRPPKEKHDE